jgi:hypothetical protein
MQCCSIKGDRWSNSTDHCRLVLAAPQSLNFLLTALQLIFEPLHTLLLTLSLL